MGTFLQEESKNDLTHHLHLGVTSNNLVMKIAHYWRYPSILSVGLLVGWMEVGSSTLCSDLQLDWDSGLTGGEVEW